MIYTPREEWGAKAGRGSMDPGPEEHVVIHHSYRPALLPAMSVSQERAAIRGIERYHTAPEPRGNGWEGIGYNFLVAPSGRVYEGRGWKYRGAHAGPVNRNSIGVCLLIDGTTMDPNKEMIDSVRELIADGIALGEIAPDYRITGHRDWMDRTCPGGLVYKRLHEFRHDTVEKVRPGAKVWSDYFKEHLIVTRYVSDTEWYFVRSSELRGRPATRARTPFSQMPKARW